MCRVVLMCDALRAGCLTAGYISFLWPIVCIIDICISSSAALLSAINLLLSYFVRFMNDLLLRAQAFKALHSRAQMR